ncbi:MAG: alkaline phosphatase [Candidatus Marinimicrobia bacterium]|nr:alkaline phosphatase [Candidatus Neomarinimicrobiota bacterium]
MMRKWGKYLIILFAIVLSACGKPEAKYVFFFIGDGMGPVQVNAAERYLASMEGRNGIVPLAMNLAHSRGNITTYSQNSYITDSGAAVTALATGNKTSNQTLSMDAEHRYPFKTIAEAAKERGMKVGIISTVDIDHATPAGYYAHQPKRSNYYEIGIQLANSNFDFFGGGGFRNITDPKGFDPVNVIDLAKKNGYLYINNATAFNYLEPGAGRVLFVHPAVSDDYAMPYSIDMDEGSIALSQITQKAIDMIDNPDGFFIMVEGGKIDWACHGNDAAATIHDVLALDEAVKVALEFYSKHKNNTLIIITADHECGGMTMGTSYGDSNMDLSKLQWQMGSFMELTREYHAIRKGLLDVLGEEALKADSSWAFDFILTQTGLGDESKGLGFNSYEIKELSVAYSRSFDEKNYNDPYEYIKYGSYDAFMIAASHMLSRKVGIGWSTFSHTGIPVPIRAFGAGAQNFAGYYDNTEVYNRLLDIIKK